MRLQNSSAAKLTLALALTVVTGSHAESASTRLDPAWNPAALQRPLHRPLAEEYIWTANDAAALRPDHARFVYRDRDQKTERHYFRAAFELKTLPSSASLYIAGPRHVRAYLNGKLVLDAGADPESPLNTHVFSFDIRPELQSGTNVLAIEAVRGVGIVAASDSPVIQQLAYGETLVTKVVAAPLHRAGRTLLISNSEWCSTTTAKDGWQTLEFDDRRWPRVQSLGPIESAPEFFQWNLDAGPYDWPGYLGMSPSLRNFNMRPARAEPRGGEFDHLDALTSASHMETLSVSIPAQETGDAPELLLDFGREVSGRILIESACTCDARVQVSYGESEAEALSGENYLGRFKLTIPAHGIARGPKSGFRYVQLRFLEGAAVTRVRSIRLEGIAYPVHYVGSFESPDPMLNRIWETAAYTAHLCMQDGVWDAPKRDRGWWAGDLDATGPVIATVFGDYSLLNDTLSRLIPPAGQHVNGIPGYTALWITALADLYQHNGNLPALERYHGILLQLLQQMDQEFDSSGHFLNRDHRWLFIDWSSGLFAFTDEAKEGTALEMLRGYRSGAWLLNALGDSAEAPIYAARAANLSQQLHIQSQDRQGTYGSTWQLNAMAVLSGATRPDDIRTIWDKVFGNADESEPTAATVSPYFNGYVLDAMAEIGHRREALNWLRSYWGGMIAEGATSFWEAYDPRWPKTNPHASLQADGRTGYFVSLAHGWSSTPATWLLEEVAGIKALSPGYRTVKIEPDLLGLGWVRGTVATPRGSLQVHARPDRVTVRIPAGVQADVVLPPGNWTQKEQVMGRTKEIQRDSRFAVSGPGTFRFVRTQIARTWPAKN